MKFSIFTYLPLLILTPKSCQDLLFIVYICIGFPWSSRSQILKELDGLELSSNPVQSSPIQSLNSSGSDVRNENFKDSIKESEEYFYNLRWPICVWNQLLCLIL